MTDNPIEAAKAMTPFWMRDIYQFDGLEIHPCRTESGEGANSFVEQCAAHEAEFWSVFGHCKQGGVCCFEDFGSLPEARAFAGELLAVWPHLHTFGVLDCGN